MHKFVFVVVNVSCANVNLKEQIVYHTLKDISFILFSASLGETETGKQPVLV